MGDLYNCILPETERVIREQIALQRSGKTIKLDVSVLNAFCNWCIQRDYLSENPLKKLGKINIEPKSFRRALTQDELQKIFNVIVANKNEFGYWQPLLPMACCSGLRSGALKALTIDSLDIERYELKLKAKDSKNRKDGTKEVSEELVRILIENFNSGIPQALYKKYYTKINSSQQPPKNPLLYIPSHPARELDKVLKLAGVPKNTREGKVDFHALRVAYATFIGEAGASLKEAQTALDHSDPRITNNIYLKTRDDRMHTLAEKVSTPIFEMLKCAQGVHQDNDTDMIKNCNPITNKGLQQKTIGGGGGNRMRVHLPSFVVVTYLFVARLRLPILAA
jgi:integrase